MRNALRLALLLSLLPGLGLAETMSVPTPRGGRLSVIADLPPGKGPFPAIVLAPGQEYHMRLPVLRETARSLVSQGLAVFRFDWSYFTAQPQGRPSDDLSKELQDLQTVLAAARRHPKVASKSVSVGGKSLGSLVAWRAFASDASLRSGLFLTPLCGSVPKGEPLTEAQRNYPGFESERRATLFITGIRDPLCAASTLYRFAANGPGAARIAIVEGDHGYEEPALTPPAAEAASKRNIAAVAALAAAFIAKTVGQNAPAAAGNAQSNCHEVRQAVASMPPCPAAPVLIVCTNNMGDFFMNLSAVRSSGNLPRSAQAQRKDAP